MKYRKLLALSLSLSILLSVGCGKKPDYDAYKEEVNKLYDSLAIANVQMNEIEIYSEESKEAFFNNIDNLQKAFDDFSKVETPEVFESCVTLAENANTYLTRSEELFHKALDNEFSKSDYESAVSYYNKSVKCINDIGLVLQGKEIEESTEE